MAEIKKKKRIRLKKKKPKVKMKQMMKYLKRRIWKCEFLVMRVFNKNH